MNNKHVNATFEVQFQAENNNVKKLVFLKEMFIRLNKEINGKEEALRSESHQPSVPTSTP
jgi:hypothetical protein